MPEKFDKELQSIDPVKERQVFIDTLVSRLGGEDLHTKNYAVQFLFSHSVSDAFTLADKLGISREDQFTDFIYSSRTHINTAEDIINGDISPEEDKVVVSVYGELLINHKYLNDNNIDFIDRTVRNFNTDPDLNLKKLLKKEIYDLVEEYYLPFIQQKRFREVKNDDGYLGRKLAYEVFETRRFVTDKNYQTDLLIKYIQEKTGKDVEFESTVAPEWEVKKRFERLGLDYDEAVTSGAIYVKSPFKEVYDVRKKEAIRELKNEIRENLIKNGHDRDSFEIVESDEGFKVVEKEVGDKDTVQEVDEDKFFELGSFERKEVDVSGYGSIKGIYNFDGKLVFSATTKISTFSNTIINYDGKELFTGVYRGIDFIRCIDDKIVFKARTTEGKECVVSFDSNDYEVSNPYPSEEIHVLKGVGGKVSYVRRNAGLDFLYFNDACIASFEEIRELISIDDKPVVSGKLLENRWVIYKDGKNSPEYDFAGILTDINGKLAFAATLNSKHLINIDGKELYIGKYKKITELKNINGKLFFVGENFDGTFVANFDGVEYGRYSRIEYFSYIGINGKLAFIAQRDDGQWVVNYNGNEIFGTNEEIRGLTDVGGKPAFILSLGGSMEYERVIWDRSSLNIYHSVSRLIDLEGKPVFMARLGDGKNIINYNNQEIPGFEFDSVRLFEYNKETGLLFISGIIGDKIVTYTKYLKSKQKELKLNSFEQNRLDLLNLIKKPDQDKEDDILLGVDTDQNTRLSTSHQFAQNLNKLIDQDPAIFFDDIRAKSEKLPDWRVEQIAERFFPEIRINKEKEKQGKERRKRESGRPMFSGLFDSFNKESSSKENPDFFRDNEYLELMDGDPSEENPKDIGIEFRTDVKGMLATNINLGASHDGRWNRLIFPISEELSGPADEVTATIEVHGKNEILLPRFTDSKIITSRIKVIDSKGKDIDFTYDKNSLGQVLVKTIKPIDKILFSQEKPVITPAPSEIENEEYSIFRKDFESRYGKSVIEDVLDLPPELNMFINSISHLSPVEKLMAIEEYVKKISYYDFDNKSVQSLKLAKNNDERLAIMQLRLEDLSDKGVDTQGKMFAGVCADFAMITTALLRKAGFVSGIVTGINMNGKKAKSSDSHGLSFIVWPSADDKTEIYIIDGTPGSHTVYTSMRDRLERKREDVDILIKDTESRLKEIEDIIASLDIEKIKSLSNGELEKALNILLRYGVKRKNLHVIESILNTKYAPINIVELDLDDMSNVVKVTRMIDSEISRERKNKKPIEDIDLDSGKKLFETMQEFIDRFSNRDKEKFSEALDKIEKIFKISEQFLEPIEAKAVFAVINYLKAKNVK